MNQGSLYRIVCESDDRGITAAICCPTAVGLGDNRRMARRDAVRTASRYGAMAWTRKDVHRLIFGSKTWTAEPGEPVDPQTVARSQFWAVACLLAPYPRDEAQLWADLTSGVPLADVKARVFSWATDHPGQDWPEVGPTAFAAAMLAATLAW